MLLEIFFFSFFSSFFLAISWVLRGSRVYRGHISYTCKIILHSDGRVEYFPNVNPKFPFDMVILVLILS